MKHTPVAASLRTAAILFAFALAGTAILAYTFDATREIIAHGEEQAKLALITQVIPRNRFDNDILRDAAILPPAKELGTEAPSLAYRARLAGRPAAVVLEAVAPDGYAGRIKLLVAILENGEIAGVRVVAHNETSGLGDYIDIAKSAWIKTFDGASNRRYGAEDWKVKKDGGRFDYMAGATVTPRAVIKAVRQALEYYEENRERLFSASSENKAQKK